MEKVLQVLNSMLANGVVEKYAIGGGIAYIFSPEHLAAELLRSGRRKDHVRVIDLIESDQLDMTLFREIVKRHNLAQQWSEFSTRFNLEE